MTTLADIQIRDPFIVADPADKLYRLYGTTGFGGTQEAPLGFVVRHSRDLKKWSEPQSVLSRIMGPQEADYYWAPEVHHYRGRWYLFATFGHGVSVLKPRARYSSIYVSDSPDGPFVPHSDGPVTPDRPQVFEPPRVLVWELVMGCIWVAVDAGPTEGGRRPTGVGAAVSWAA